MKLSEELEFLLRQHTAEVNDIIMKQKARPWMSRLALFSSEKEPNIYEYASLHFTGYINTAQIEEIVAEINEKLNYEVKHMLLVKISFSQVFIYGIDRDLEMIKATIYPRRFVKRVVTYHTNQEKLIQERDMQLLKKLMETYAESRKSVLAN